LTYRFAAEKATDVSDDLHEFARRRGEHEIGANLNEFLCGGLGHFVLCHTVGGAVLRKKTDKINTKTNQLGDCEKDYVFCGEKKKKKKKKKKKRFFSSAVVFLQFQLSLSLNQ
jgi:hypothetical protein